MFIELLTELAMCLQRIIKQLYGWMCEGISLINETLYCIRKLLMLQTSYSYMIRYSRRNREYFLKS